MKRIFNLLLVLVLLICLAPSAYGAELPKVIDDAELLTAQEEEALTQKADTILEDYGMEAVILTCFSLDGKSPEAYADDFYDENGYGEDGILFLLSMEYRDWYISTSGDGIYAFTDYGIQQLGAAALPDLAAGQYYEAFDTYLNALIPYLDALSQGSPIDGNADYSGDYYSGTREDMVYYQEEPSFGHLLLTSLPVGLILAAVAVLTMGLTMNTKRRQGSASVYMKEHSFRLGLCQDMFLYSNVSKTRRPEHNSSSSGGGSSVHRSSSGRSHGGGGGKF